ACAWVGAARAPGGPAAAKGIHRHAELRSGRRAGQQPRRRPMETLRVALRRRSALTTRTLDRALGLFLTSAGEFPGPKKVGGLAPAVVVSSRNLRLFFRSPPSRSGTGTGPPCRTYSGTCCSRRRSSCRLR